MTNSKVLLFTFFIAFSSLLYAVTPAIPRNPDEPWRGDPDISAVDDELVLELWRNTVITYRRANPTGSLVDGLHRKPIYTSVSKDKETQEYLIASLTKSLQSDPVNWDKVRVLIILMYAGMDIDPRIPEIAEQLFKMPRPMKMSDAWHTAYREMLRLLTTQQSPEAVALLAAATYREFWGNDPFHVRDTGKDSELAIHSMRSLALELLTGCMPPTLAIPHVKEMMNAYPESRESEKVVTVSNGKKFMTTKQGEDFSQQLLNIYLDKLYERLEESSATTSDAAEQ